MISLQNLLRRCAAFLALAAAFFCAHPAVRAEEKPNPLFSGLQKKLDEMAAAKGKAQPGLLSARYVPGEKQSVVQIPRYTYTGPGGETVELTGVVHIADQTYYEDLNKHLAEFDAVLFEMLGDADKIDMLRKKGAGADKDGKDALDTKSPLADIYRTMAHDILSMAMQLDVVDYSKPNFVHADLGETEFNGMLKEKGYTLDKLIAARAGAAGMSINLEQIRKLLPLMKAFVPKNDPHALKRAIAPLMNTLPDSGLGVPEADALIVTARNKRAMEVLDRELKAGKKKISLFFGSAHLKDFAQQLEARGWKKTDEKWVDAWVIPAAGEVKTEPAAAPGKSDASAEKK
jgi:hypothetical protein